MNACNLGFRRTLSASARTTGGTTTAGLTTGTSRSKRLGGGLRAPLLLRRLAAALYTLAAPLRQLRLVLALTVTATLASGCGYNAVIDQDENVKAAWGEVQNQYQRRADLVPNLVSTVKGAADFEKETLESVVQARSRVGQMNVDSSVIDDPEKFKQFEQAQGQLSGALSRLLVVAERYPELRATEAFRDLQVQLEGTENRIAVARKRYVEAVSEYNKTVLRFPTSIGAKMRGKDVRPTFEATTPGAEQAPEVAF